MTRANSSRFAESRRQTPLGSHSAQKKQPISADSAAPGGIRTVLDATMLTDEVVAKRYPVPLRFPNPLRLSDGSPRNHFMGALMRLLLQGQEHLVIVHISKACLAELRQLLRAYSFVIRQDLCVPYFDSHHRQLVMRVIVTNAQLTPAGSGDNSLFDDRVSDTLWACLMLALSQGGHRRPTDPIPFSVEEVLTMAGRKQSGGGYLSAQIRAAMNDLHVLCMITIEILLPRWLGDLEMVYTGTLLHMADESWGDYDLTTGATLWQRQCLRFGEWIRLLPSLSETTVASMQRVLRYHPQHDRVAKRLGRYLLWEFAAREDLSRGSTTAPYDAARTNVAVDITMGELLDAAAVPQDRHQPLRCKKMIEDALALLQSDQIIGAYERLPAQDQEAAERMRLVDHQAYGWWEHYLGLCWRISTA